MGLSLCTGMFYFYLKFILYFGKRNDFFSRMHWQFHTSADVIIYIFKRKLK